LLPAASGQNEDGAVTFHTEATIYRADLDKGQAIDFETSDTRRIFVYVTEGGLDVNGQTLNAKDQARIDLESGINLKALDDTGLVLIDVPSCKGWGYNAKTLKGARK
jgi:redox-sensitive bicupin YhaK (pirin superfamily)